MSRVHFFSLFSLKGNHEMAGSQIVKSRNAGVPCIWYIFYLLLSTWLRSNQFLPTYQGIFQRLLSTLLNWLKLVYGPFGSSNMHCTLVFCARKVFFSQLKIITNFHLKLTSQSIVQKEHEEVYYTQLITASNLKVSVLLDCSIRHSHQDLI